MDMSVPVSPIILHVFYRMIGIEFLIAFAACAAVFWLVRRTEWFKRQFSIQSEWRLDAASVSSRAAKVQNVIRIAFGCIWIIDGVLQAQPDMTTQFIPGLIGPIISGLPGVLPELLSPLTYLWTIHPLFFDSLSVWMQVLIGVGVLFGPARRAGRIALYTSIAWAAVVWVIGEGFGVLGGATWLTGAPGAVLLYALAAVLLLQPPVRWTNGTIRNALYVAIGILWLVCALLQALPDAGFWQVSGLQGAELSMAEMSQPLWMAAPLFAVAHAFAAHPVAWNATFVIILAALGILWITRPRLPFLQESTLVFTLLTWWIGQDFGVVGSMGTDLNTGGPLLVLCLAAISLRGVVYEQTTAKLERTKRTLRPVLISTGSAVLAMAAGSVGASMAATQSSGSLIQQEAANSAVTPVNQPLPNLTLTNQYGNQVSLASYRGKAVVLTFLDPVCYQDCPILAQEMKQADQLLGPYANKVQMVAIAANPLFHSVKDVQRFDAQENMNGLSNWSFLTSNNLSTLKNAWHRLYEYVSVPSLGMVDHAENMYFVSPSGQEVWLADANGDISGSGSYSSFMAAYAEKLLGVTASVNGGHNVAPTTYHSGLQHPGGFDTIQMTSAQVGYATAFVSPYNEVVKTTDGGKRWKSVTPTGETQRGGFLVAPVSSDKVYALVPQYGYVKNSSLFVTTDGGTQWTPVGQPGPTPHMYGANNLSVGGGGSLWLTGAAKTNGQLFMYRSNDDGAQWDSVALPLTNASSFSWTTEPVVWKSASNGQVVVVGKHGSEISTEVFTTTDAGKTWIRSGQTVTRQTGATGPANVVVNDQYARGHHTFADANTRYVDAIGANAVYRVEKVGTGAQVEISQDGGKTWATLFAGKLQ
ncbi:SCO family protein [Alicyclobacillus ferrooxydans]|uniref:SCO family protein n=1 Tax=Alicyclobacillus ferrooxydans TaxID=471514 RepID=UPI0006D56E26|nr:SCO family protein [Alicyclobacillus ferrooxydans]